MGPHLLISVAAGSVFGAVFRYQPGGYAALISNGLFYALLLWIIGPLTLTPLVLGDDLTWYTGEAQAAFSTLIGHLLYGGLTGFSFYVSLTLYLRRRPERVAPEVTRPVKRVVILDGGFGGISTA